MPVPQPQTQPNAGTVIGGITDSCRAAFQMAAIMFGTGTNRLVLENGSDIQGADSAHNSADDTLALGGSADSSFNLSEIDPTKYSGFEHFEKTGTRTGR